MNDSKQITLTISQQRVLDKILAFLDSADKVFVLNGYAGTGKTTMMRFLVERLQSKERGYHILASTGRAAAVLNGVIGSAVAQTIHSMIYRYEGFNQDISQIKQKQTVDGQLYLVFAPCRAESTDKKQVYIIDEASMISDIESRNITQAAFGSGRLLKELIEYDGDPEAKFIFVGDPCQLPPVGQTKSPALSPEYIRQTFGCGVQEASLTEIIRQGDGNTIVSAAQRLRQLYTSAPETDDYYRGRYWGHLPIYSNANIQLHPNDEDLVRHYIEVVNKYGFDYATFITRANAKCYQLAVEIRCRLGFKGTVQMGDLLLVTQNNASCGLVNGDFVVVESVSNCTTVRAGLQFRKVRIRPLHGSQSQDTLLLEDVLYGGRQNLDSEQQKELFVDFILRMSYNGVGHNHPLFEQMMRNDPFLNALRCTFGYAITCHKSQGGEWAEVFLNMPRNIMFNPTKSSYQWVYTSMTRAKEKLHLVDDIYLESSRMY